MKHKFGYEKLGKDPIYYIHLLMLKVDSKAMVKMRMTNASLVISVRIGYLTEFIFHQAKISNLGVDASHLSKKYLSTFDLHSKLFSSTRCCVNSNVYLSAFRTRSSSLILKEVAFKLP